MVTSESDTREAALAYLAHGWSVVPIAAAGKRPLVRWEAYQRALPEAAEVRHWFERWPDANVGIVTGAVSGILVLDVDLQHDGDASLAQLERRFAPLPATVEAISGGGGRHVYFAHPGGVVGNRTAIAPGLDLRGDGGLVVAPPSRHTSGRRYRWHAAHQPDKVPLAEMPAWLASLVRGESAHPGHPLAHWRSLVRGGVEEGARNSTIASLTGHLLWRGVDPSVALELLLCWNRVRCTPPLSDEEVARTVESVTRTHARHGVGPADDD